MDLESIKIIADTATQLTGEAKQVFVWWLLGKEILGSLLTFAFFITVVALGYRLIRAQVSNNGASAYIKLKREEYSTGSPGILTDSELSRTIQEIERRLKEANK